LSLKVGSDGGESIEKYFKPFQKFVRSALKCGENVLIHDMNCKTRAPAFAVAFLISEKRMTLKTAMAHLKVKCPTAKLSTSIVLQLQNFASSVKEE
jgi:hypothetical protein